MGLCELFIAVQVVIVAASVVKMVTPLTEAEKKAVEEKKKLPGWRFGDY